MIRNSNKKNNRKCNNNNQFNKQLKMKYKSFLLRIINLMLVYMCHQKEKGNLKKNKNAKTKKQGKLKRVQEKKNNKC